MHISEKISEFNDLCQLLILDKLSELKIDVYNNIFLLENMEYYSIIHLFIKDASNILRNMIYDAAEDEDITNYIINYDFHHLSNDNIMLNIKSISNSRDTKVLKLSDLLKYKKLIKK